MIGDRCVQVETTEPAVGQVQVDLLAEPALGANAKAVANDQHADHQLRIDRRTSCVAVERRQVVVQLAQIEEAIDAAQQVAGWNVIIEIERVEKLVLAAALPTHHPDAPSVVMGSRTSEKDA